MSNTEEIKIPLKILVDKGRNKVLFAEADYRFVDTLFSFMTLPMGTIARLIEKIYASELPSVGCLNTLYGGLANLPSEYFSTEEVKLMLLHPRNSMDAQCRKLKLNVDDTKYFICGNRNCSQRNGAHFCTYNTAKCSCGMFLDREIVLEDSRVNSDHGDRGVFVTEAATFLVTDDLCVMPNLTSSSLQMLSDVGIRDMKLLEERTINIGLQEVLKLLKLALLSRSPLTDLFLCETHTVSVKSVLGNFTQPVISEGSPTSSKKMDLRVFVQKSNGKPLFYQAEDELIGFVFSFLAIPLGAVLFLLSGNTSAGSIDNLYRSISNLNEDRHMISWGIKDMLLHPKLPQNYFSEYNIFTLKEESSPTLYCHCNKTRSGTEDFYITTCLPPGATALGLHDSYNGYGEAWSSLAFQGPMLHGGYVKKLKPVMFTVTDDLVVTPVSSISIMSILDKLQVPFSDVEEREVSIGIEEGLSILKASLSSSSALSSGLNLFLKKLKQEK